MTRNKLHVGNGFDACVWHPLPWLQVLSDLLLIFVYLLFTSNVRPLICIKGRVSTHTSFLGRLVGGVIAVRIMLLGLGRRLDTG